MYAQYKYVDQGAPQFIECSVCFGRPIFIDEHSYLVHHEEYHRSPRRLPSCFTDIDYLSTKQEEDIETLTAKIASHQSNINEVKDELQWMMGVISSHQQAAGEKVDQTSEPLVVGFRKRPSRINALKGKAVKLKEEELKEIEKLRILQLEQEQVEEKLFLEKKSNQNNVFVTDTASETFNVTENNLQSMMADNFKIVIKKIDQLETKVDSKVCNARSSKMFNTDFESLISEKDELIESYKDENETLMQKHAELKAQMVILKTETKVKARDKSNENQYSLEELSYQARKLKLVNSMWQGGAPQIKGEIGDSKSEIEILQEQITKKEKILSEITLSESKCSKQLQSADNKIKELKSQLLTHQTSIEDLQNNLCTKENELKLKEELISKCKQKSELNGKLLLEGCIKKLEEKYDVENKTKELQITELADKLFEVERLYKQSNEVIAALEKDKIQLRNQLDHKEEYNQQSYEETLSKYTSKTNILKQQLIEDGELHKLAIEKSLNDLKDEYEQKLIEQRDNFKEQINFKNNDIDAKKQEVEDLNKTNENMKQQLAESNAKLAKFNNDIESVQQQAQAQMKKIKLKIDQQQELIDSLQDMLSKSHGREERLKEERRDYECRIEELEISLKKNHENNEKKRNKVLQTNEKLKKQLETCMEELDESKLKISSTESPICCSKLNESKCELDKVSNRNNSVATLEMGCSNNSMGEKANLFEPKHEIQVNDPCKTESVNKIFINITSSIYDEEIVCDESIEEIISEELDLNDTIDDIDGFDGDYQENVIYSNHVEAEPQNHSAVHEPKPILIIEHENGELAQPVHILADRDERDEVTSWDKDENDYLQDSFEGEDDEPSRNDEPTITLNFHAMTSMHEEEIGELIEEAIDEELELSDDEDVDGFEYGACTANQIPPADDTIRRHEEVSDVKAKIEPKKSILGDLPPLTKLPPLLTPSSKHKDIDDDDISFDDVDIDALLDEIEPVKCLKRFF